MRFRQHRGGLGASVETTVDVPDLAALVLHLNGRFPMPLSHSILEAGDLTFIPYGGDDVRIGWRDVHIVRARRMILGFVEGNPLKAEAAVDDVALKAALDIERVFAEHHTGGQTQRTAKIQNIVRAAIMEGKGA